MKSEESKKNWVNIVMKAWSDPKFKERLLKNPKETCRLEGLDFEEKEVKIPEIKQDTLCLQLPEKPSGELSPEQLKGVAAGAVHCEQCGHYVTGIL